eukprot:m.39156 g.39156  ORF g.39156 m.39156 type:complete len:79 (-) comp45490_c0_seq3:958-1194(-)
MPFSIHHELQEPSGADQQLTTPRLACERLQEMISSYTKLLNRPSEMGDGLAQESGFSGLSFRDENPTKRNPTKAARNR